MAAQLQAERELRLKLLSISHRIAQVIPWPDKGDTVDNINRAQKSSTQPPLTSFQNMLFKTVITYIALSVSAVLAVGAGGPCGSHSDCDGGLACLLQRTVEDGPIVRQCVDGR